MQAFRKFMLSRLLPIMLAGGLTTTARADDWGCQVLLCLANPAGPMAVQQCVPPIQRLYTEVLFAPWWARRPFPTCAMAQSGGTAAGGVSSGAGSWAELKNMPNQCPAGTSLVNGGYVAGAASGAQWVREARESGYAWNVDWSQLYWGGPQYPDENNQYLDRTVCAGGQYAGSFRVIADSESGTWYDVGVYEQVAVLDPPANGGRAIVVYINGSVYRIVRY